MTIEEARDYWQRRFERTVDYSDEHWDAEERREHRDYIDAMKYAITALTVCIEHKNPTTNGDKIRQMTDEELAEFIVRHVIIGAIQANGATGELAKSMESDAINSACGKKDIETALSMLREVAE